MEKISYFKISSLSEPLPTYWYYSAGFRFYWATLTNQKKVILAFKNNEYYYLVSNDNGGNWESIQKSIDKFIIKYAVDLIKTKYWLPNLKMRACSKWLKINDEKIYIKNIDSDYTFTLQIKHDYTGFINEVLDYVDNLE